MATLETVGQVRAGDVERLVCHPRLPLAAGLDSERPAVRIWDCGDGKLRELDVIGAGLAGYGDDSGWKRFERTPSVAWHPEQPLLLVAYEDGVVQWHAGVLSELTATAYRHLAFSPDGRAVWASPSSRDDERRWEASDVLGSGSVTVGIGRRWDTGIAVHPAGGLVFHPLQRSGCHARHLCAGRSGATANCHASAAPGTGPGGRRLRDADL